jgi:signal transduction histidine kinase
MRMKRSIRSRLVGSYVLLALLTVAAAGVVAQGLVAREVARRQAATLRTNAEAIAAEALPFLWPTTREAALLELARSASFLLDARVEIEGMQGQVLADSGAVGEAQAFLLFDDPAIEPGELSHLEALLGSHAPGMVVPADAGEAPEVVVDGDVHARAYRVFVRREGGPWGGQLSFDWLGEGGAGRNGSAPTGAPKAGVLRIGATQPRATGSSREIDRDEVIRVEALEIIEGADVAWIGDEHDGEGGHRNSFRLSLAKPGAVAPVVAAVGDPAEPMGRVRISEGTDLRPAALAARHAFSLAALVAALVAAGAGLVVARGMSAPLSALAETAGRMAEGDLSARAEPRGEDEIASLSRQFNHMADGLQESFDALAAERDALRRFIADASHELRTPITALRNFNELLLGPAEDDPEARAEFLAESAAQLDRLEWITGHLLDLSRLEAGLVTMEREPVSAEDLLAAAAAPFRPAAEARGVRLEVEVTSPFELWVDRGRMILALSNLVDNALRHAPDGGHVTIGARRDPSDVEERGGVADRSSLPLRLWVTDDGPGVPPAERGRVFERFYRGVDAPPGGTGLGLAIVEGIVRAHGGTVGVSDSESGGARFDLRLPIG